MQVLFGQVSWCWCLISTSYQIFRGTFEDKQKSDSRWYLLINVLRYLHDWIDMIRSYLAKMIYNLIFEFRIKWYLRAAVMVNNILMVYHPRCKTWYYWCIMAVLWLIMTLMIGYVTSYDTDQVSLWSFRILIPSFTDWSVGVSLGISLDDCPKLIGFWTWPYSCIVVRG